MTDLSDHRCEQVAAARFFNNPRIKVDELIHRATRLNLSALSSPECLVYIDGSCINVSLDASGRPALLTQLGCIDNQGKKPGYSIMPTLVVDSQRGVSIGLSDIIIYSRPVHHPDPKANERLRQQRSKLPFDQKESGAWALAVSNTMAQLSDETQPCFISDQGSDIYEFYEHLVRWPNARFIIRAKNNREVSLHTDDQLQRLDDLMEAQPIMAQSRQFISGLDHYSKTKGKKRQRLARLSTFDLRYVQAWSYPPASKSGKVDKDRAVLITYIDVCEQADHVPPNEKPIHWRLATNRVIEEPLQAWQAVEDYTGRWTIEQLFRTLKLDGLNIERSQFNRPEALKKVLIMSLSTTVKTQQLVQLRNGQNDVQLEDILDHRECEVIRQINTRLEGRTKKLKNPHYPQKAAFGSWVVARLGGWSGYACEKPPGYKRMARGMAKLKTIVEFYPTKNTT